MNIQSALNELDSLKKIDAPDSVLVSANLRKNAAVIELNEYFKKFIRTTPNATLGVLALGWASRSLPPAEMDSALKNLKTRFPANTFLAEMEKAASNNRNNRPPATPGLAKRYLSWLCRM